MILIVFVVDRTAEVSYYYGLNHIKEFTDGRSFFLTKNW